MTDKRALADEAAELRGEYEESGLGKLLSDKEVLERKIQWKSLGKVNLISEDALKLILDFDQQQAPEIKEQLLDEAGEVYAQVFLTMLLKVNNEEVQQYLLALIDSILKDDDRIPLFLKVKDLETDEKSDGLPFTTPFQKLLNSSSDTYITGKAVRILALLLVESDEDCKDEGKKIIRWCLNEIKSSKGNLRKVYVAISGFQVILRRDSFRHLFIDQGGLTILANVLKQNMDKQQLIYMTLYCLWIMSFNAKIAAKFHSIETLIPDIVEIIRKKSKAKIRRIGLAVLRNILGKSKKNNKAMIDSGFPRVLRYLNQKKWGDVDIENDLEVLTEALETEVNELTSWDIYKKEVLSGNLAWSPPHKSDKFWKENIGRFDENSFEVVQHLLDMINNSSDPIKLAVACYDLGEFVRLHPRGRRVLVERDGKKQIMFLMTHGNEEVQKHALLAVQKMFVNNFEYLPRT